MRVLVLGSGVIGVASAYYLAKAGHDVTVVDRQPGPGLETSYANAGEISPGYSSPWAAPGLILKAVKWLLMRDGPLVIRPLIDLRMWLWGLRLLANTSERAYALNKSRMVRLAEYSRDRMIELRAATGIAYDDRQQGTLQLFRTQRQLDHTHADIEVLEQYGVPYELLDPAGCIGAEPGLATARTKFAGGLRLPNDETGDCKLFTDALARMCEAMGVVFRYGTRVETIVTEAGRVTGVAAGTSTLKADAYVVALGSFSPIMLRPLGINVPVYHIKG